MTVEYQWDTKRRGDRHRITPCSIITIFVSRGGKAVLSCKRSLNRLVGHFHHSLAN